MGRRSLAVAIMFVIFGLGGAAQQAQEAPIRYGIHPRLQDYPQGTAKETLASVLTALDDNQVAYVLAQLTDPVFVDQRVGQVYGGRFEELLKEATTKLADNPNAVKELRRFLLEGDWQGTDTSASATVKDIRGRQVFLAKIGDRWYLENRQK
jgi:hypothetical protein